MTKASEVKRERCREIGTLGFGTHPGRPAHGSSFACISHAVFRADEK